MEIGDLSKRLKDQKNKVGPKEIEWGTANRTILQSVNGVIGGKRCKRAIVIIDRRKGDKDKKDVLFVYQPNTKLYCDGFECDQQKFLHESLMQNSRTCLLPKIESEHSNISINTQFPLGLILSFHIFAANEVRVYFSFNGWGTRFFIEDIKYFLPEFFVKDQEPILRNAFEKAPNRDFANKYEQTKTKCNDIHFETFYTSLIDGKKPH